MYYLYSYSTVIDFSTTISRHTVRLRCRPVECSYQTIHEEHLILPPSFWWQHSHDGLDNVVTIGGTDKPHESLTYISSGIVEHTSSYIIVDPAPHPMYRLSSSLTQYRPEMLTLLPPVLRRTHIAGDIKAEEFLEIILAVNQSVHQWMTYTPNFTTMQSTAYDAFLSRKGVCQDYAHLMIALCRALGFYSRYVCGLIEGHGATHAWVEVHDGQYWYGFDPTNNNAIATGYIKIAHGRDVNDCPVSRGSFVGKAIQTTSINVMVSK